MKPEIAKEWAAALRSGDFKQGKKALKDSLGYCCLGVLCELYRRITGHGKWDGGKFIVGSSYSLMVLPSPVAEWANSEDNPKLAGQYATILNDGYNPNGGGCGMDPVRARSFEEIAALVERETV